MKVFLLLNALCALCISSAWANVEKIIFIAPGAVNIPSDGPSLANLQLQTLSPQNTSLTTKLSASFSTDEQPRGETSWYILHGLNEGQRYELRLCWPAIQPTTFWIDYFQLDEVFSEPSLLSTLASYSESRQVQAESDGNNLIPAVSSSTVAGKQSVLFIRIQAAADYYSADKDLMANVAPISVDIILDPYLMNIFPKSLVSTAIWVVLVAVAGYFIAQIISRYIQIVSSVNQTKKES